MTTEPPITTQLDPATLTGTAEFPIRGDCWCAFEKTGRDTARLTIRFPQSGWRHVADMILVDEGIDAEDYWHCYAQAEGYEYRVHMTRGGLLSFIDAPQPHRGPYAETDENGAPVLTDAERHDWKRGVGPDREFARALKGGAP